ncbi:MAG: hypothetical protein U0996_01090 [Planctomycetaceae bacterium]
MIDKTSDRSDKRLVPRLVRGTSRAGVGAGAVLIGLALFMLFRGFGLGPGSGPGEGGTGEAEQKADEPPRILAADTSPQDREKKDEADSETEPVAPGGETGLTFDEEKAIASNVLTVLIDEHDYLMQVPGTTDAVYRRADLARLVELAKRTKGDSNGIRVRILRRESARASAENQIKADLVHAGIGTDAIVMPRDFVP